MAVYLSKGNHQKVKRRLAEAISIPGMAGSQDQAPRSIAALRSEVANRWRLPGTASGWSEF